jgi:hypothetical protein
VKTENHDEKVQSMESSANDSPLKQPSDNERVQKIIEKGSPEELEAEVRSSQLFLENLKAPMTGIVSVNKDAQHWVQQISQNALFLLGILY